MATNCNEKMNVMWFLRFLEEKKHFEQKTFFSKVLSPHLLKSACTTTNRARECKHFVKHISFIISLMFGGKGVFGVFIFLLWCSLQVVFWGANLLRSRGLFDGSLHLDYYVMLGLFQHCVSAWVAHVLYCSTGVRNNKRFKRETQHTQTPTVTDV